METRDFYDHIYQVWSRTTGSEDRYWMPEAYADGSGRFNIYAVGQDETRKLIASSVSDRDSDFISAVHGCFADLIRSLGSSLDEADRLDEEKDTLIVRIAELEMQVDSFRDQIEDLHELVAAGEARIAELVDR